MAEFLCAFFRSDIGTELVKRERIVRCRDCTHYYPREGFGCSLLGKWNGRSHGFVACDMGADGFCAWGSPRGEE